MSVVRLIVATRSSGPPAIGNIIKEMPVSVASGTRYICYLFVTRERHHVAITVKRIAAANNENVTRKLISLSLAFHFSHY